MIRDGLFERCPMEAVHGLHNWPQLPVGCFGWRSGPITAGAAKLKIAILGRGCHAAFPHLGVDPVVVASHVVCGLQTIVSRMVDPVESGVVTIAQMTAGSACNVIPDSATMQGTLRWSRPSVGELLEKEVRRIATGIAESLGAVADVTIEPVMPATINDPAFAELSCRAAVAVAGETRVQRLETPSMPEMISPSCSTPYPATTSCSAPDNRRRPCIVRSTTSTTTSCRSGRRIGSRSPSSR